MTVRPCARRPSSTSPPSAEDNGRRPLRRDPRRSGGSHVSLRRFSPRCYDREHAQEAREKHSDGTFGTTGDSARSAVSPPALRRDVSEASARRRSPRRLGSVPASGSQSFFGRSSSQPLLLLAPSLELRTLASSEVRLDTELRVNPLRPPARRLRLARSSAASPGEARLRYASAWQDSLSVAKYGPRSLPLQTVAEVTPLPSILRIRAPCAKEIARTCSTAGALHLIYGQGLVARGLGYQPPTHAIDLGGVAPSPAKTVPQRRSTVAARTSWANSTRAERSVESLPALKERVCTFS